MVNVFLHNMYVLLITADLLMAYFSCFNFFSTKTNSEALKIDQYKVIRAVARIFLNAFESKTWHGFVNEFLVFKGTIL